MGNPPAHVQALALFGLLGHLNTGELPIELVEECFSETRPVRRFGSLCLKKAVPPLYPPLAKQAHITGRVRVEFTVTATGQVEQPKASGHPLLISSAIDAVRKSTFETSPPSNDRYAVTIDYELSGNSSEPGRPAFDVVPPNYWRIVVRPPLLNVETGRPNTGSSRLAKSASG
jgi:TonB family protein